MRRIDKIAADRYRENLRRLRSGATPNPLETDKGKEQRIEALKANVLSFVEY